MHPYGWYYSCRNFLFFFPVWHSEGKTRGILAGLNENAFTRWWIAVWSSHSGKIPTWGEKRLSSFVSSIACYWCNPTITTTSSLSITISTHGESHGVTDFGVGSLTLLRLMNYHSWRFSFPLPAILKRRILRVANLTWFRQEKAKTWWTSQIQITINGNFCVLKINLNLLNLQTTYKPIPNLSYRE